MAIFHLGWFTEKGPHKSQEYTVFPSFFPSFYDLWGPFLGCQPKWKSSKHIHWVCFCLMHPSFHIYILYVYYIVHHIYILCNYIIQVLLNRVFRTCIVNTIRFCGTLQPNHAPKDPTNHRQHAKQRHTRCNAISSRNRVHRLIPHDSIFR